MPWLLITGLLTTVIILELMFLAESRNNCINAWSFTVEGLSENETDLHYFQSVDLNNNIHMIWHWKVKKSGGRWTSSYVRTFNRAFDHGAFHYQNSLTNESARLKWEITMNGLSWKITGDKVIEQPAWNITICKDFYWGFTPGIDNTSNWNFYVGNTNITSGDENHNKETQAEYIEEPYDRKKRQTDGTYPRNILEWVTSVVRDIFGTGRSSRASNNRCSIILQWLEGLFNIGRGNGTGTSSTTESPDPDTEYLDTSQMRTRDVETVTESKNKKRRKTPRRLTDEYEDYD